MLALGTFLSAVSAGTTPLAAQSVVGFRSGFTEGTGIPPRGSVDLDYGSSVTTTGDIRTYSAGEVTAHVPLARRVGVRVHLNSFTWTRTPGGTIAAREDVGVGTAISVREPRAWRPMLALLTRVDAPSGTQPDRSRQWRPAAKVVLAWRLPAGIALASNLGVARPSDRGTRFSQQFGSLWVARGLTSRLGSFTEVVVTSREAPAGPSTTVVRGGLTLLATDAVHFDVHASTQLGVINPRRTVGIGLKERF